MRKGRRRVPLLVLAALVGCWAGSLPAEDVEKKFRIGGGLGFMNNRGSIESDSANTLVLVDTLESPVDFYRDPRADSAVFGALEVKPAPAAAIYGQYAPSKLFLIELSAGYQQTELGDVEVQFEALNVFVPSTERFRFQTFRIEAGDIEQIPIQLTFFARFRPRASFNPYLGAGLGYTFIGYEPSEEFNELSVNMDNSQGEPWMVTSGWFGTEATVPVDPTAPSTDLDGAEVNLKGNWEWHVAGGFELSIKRKWALFLDLRYVFATRKAEIRFNGEQSLGTSVPQLTDFCANPPGNFPPGVQDPSTFPGCPGSVAGAQALNGEFGPENLSIGGLLDAGQTLTKAQVQAQYPELFSSWCDPNPNQQTCYIPVPDGNLDRGQYYVQGGEFNLDAVTGVVGIRYTF